MTLPLRVLFVEDSERDVELLVLHLERAGYVLDYACVDTREAMQAALDSQPWDIVLSDFAMPQFDGIAALQVLQERDLDIPFILVSGTIGEDTAVTAMKAGAHDYLVKTNL